MRQKASRNAGCFQGRFRSSIFQKINDFWPPKWSPKSSKTMPEISLQNYSIFVLAFCCFWTVSGIPNWSEITKKARTSISGKSLFYHSKINVFHVRGPPEIDVFTFQNACSKRTSAKHGFEPLSASICDPFLSQNAMPNEACFATLWKSPGNQRKLTGTIVCKASIRPGI